MSFNLEDLAQAMKAISELRKARTPEEMGHVAEKWRRVLLTEWQLEGVRAVIKDREREDPELALQMKEILRFLSNAMAQDIPRAVAEEKHILAMLDEADVAYLTAAPMNTHDVLLKYQDLLLSDRGFHRAKWKVKEVEAGSDPPPLGSKSWFESEDRRLKIRFLEDARTGTIDEAAKRYAQGIRAALEKKMKGKAVNEWGKELESSVPRNIAAMSKEELKTYSNQLRRIARTPDATLAEAEQLREIARHIAATYPLITGGGLSEDAAWAVNCLLQAEEIYFRHGKACEEALECLEEAYQIEHRAALQVLPPERVYPNEWRWAADKRRAECESGEEPEPIG